jgi:hypothetical protein
VNALLIHNISSDLHDGDSHASGLNSCPDRAFLETLMVGMKRASP